MRDLLDAKNVTWKYYVPPVGQNFGRIMSAFDVIAPVRYGSEQYFIHEKPSYLPVDTDM